MAKAHVPVVRLTLQQAEISEIEFIPLLCSAAIRGSNEITRLLINAGASANENRTNSSIRASFDGNVKIVKLFLESGADGRDEEDKTLYAANPIAMWKILLDVGADIHSQQHILIHMTVGNQEDEVMDQVKFLIDRGADITVAINVAKSQPDPEIYRWLHGVVIF